MNPNAENTADTTGHRTTRSVNDIDPDRKPWEVDLVAMVDGFVSAGKEILPVGAGEGQFLFVNSAPVAQQILVTQHRKFATMPFALSRISDTFTPTGKTLLKLRNETESNLERPKIDQALSKCFHQLSVQVSQPEASGAPVECLQLSKEILISLMVRLLWDLEIECDTTQLVKAVSALERYKTYLTLGPVELPDQDKLSLQAAHTLQFQHAAGIIRKLIPEFSKHNSEVFSELNEEPAEGSFNEACAVITRTLMNAFNGPATALSWLIQCTAFYPGIQENIQHEVSKIASDHPIGFESIHSLQFTRQVVMECLRMYPPAWLLGRVALETLEVNGTSVSKGTHVVISPYTLHRNPRYWNEADTFDPAHFTAERIVKQTPFSYLPFSGGPGKCPAGVFAINELTFLIAAIVQRFELAAVGEFPRPWGLTAFRPISGVFVKFINR